MTGLVRTFNDRTGVATRQISQYGGATINSIAETDDLSGQAFTPASIATLTPSEVGAQYFMTDTRIESDPFSVRNDAAQDLGGAMATKMETDLIGQFSNFTGGTVGTAGSALTWSYLFAMEAILKANKAPYPYFTVVHPSQWYNVAKAASVAIGNAADVAPTPTPGVVLMGGGTDVDAVMRITAGSQTAYYPFPGFPQGHPTRLGGQPSDIEAHCRSFMEKGCSGCDILAYRATEADPAGLVKAARKGLGKGYLIVAGSVASAARIADIAAAGADAVTIGTAVFDGSYAPRMGSTLS